VPTCAQQPKVLILIDALGSQAPLLLLLQALERGCCCCCCRGVGVGDVHVGRGEALRGKA